MKDEGLQDWMEQLQRQLGGGGGCVVAPGVSRASMSRHELVRKWPIRLTVTEPIEINRPGSFPRFRLSISLL